MERSQIESLTTLGQSLWGYLQVTENHVEESLSHASLLNLNASRTFERTVLLMIQQAEKNPPNLLKLNHPYFRLTPLERFLLVALHLEKWSYQRISQVLSVEIALVESWAWATRIQFGYEHLGLTVDLPRGSAHLGSLCPDFDPSRPWVQKILDDDSTTRPAERNQTQNHLMTCNRCRKILHQAQILFYKIEENIPLKKQSDEKQLIDEQLLMSWQNGQAMIRPILTTTRSSLEKFFRRSDIQFASGILLILGWKILSV